MSTMVGGGAWFFSLILILPIVFFLFFLSLPGVLSDLVFLIFIGASIGSLSSIFIFFLKIVLFEPRGAPVRFNRKRQKVYVYEFQKSIWPWKRWHP
ncbi:DUF6708 domain-containing protein, partial [Enterobacter mori]|uniref:DUF6708 domain-containing protein n=1 Tax=Enterobacter mori TaxID=539813 RepID=UPI002AA2B3D4